ncbi:MAG: TatD family hydrolase [Acidobacteriota bacterium]|nr:TatD family hydrolase [Acidobacteriota bacterium]
MAPVIDTHAHLCDAAFTGDLEQVLKRAQEAGVAGIVAVGENLADAKANLQLAAEYPQLVHAAAGLFPTVLDLDAAEEMVTFIRAHSDRLIAVGEVGLDLWKVQDDVGRGIQREILSILVDLAIELDLPLNVHSRSAGRQTIEVLLERGARKVQLHAFDGRAANAAPGVEAGYYFSVPPSIARSAQKQKLVHRLPLETLLAETDSPVLAAQADRRNEPCNVRESIAAVAEIKGLSASEVGQCMWENTRRLYGPRIGG